MARDGERGRGDWKARLGSHNSGPYADDSGDSGPVDIVAVRRDDALIDAIASDGPVETDSDEEFQLAALLASWRSEIVDEELPAGPDLDEIVAAVNQEIGARQVRAVANKRGHLRLVRPLMGAAAAIALIAGGMTAFSYSAQPGDPLWKVKEVVFSEQAQTTIANTATDDMAKAQIMIDQHEPERAKALLQSAHTNATQVNDPGRQKTLTNHWNQVWTSLNSQAPAIAASLLPTPPTVTGLPTTPAVPTSSASLPPGGGLTPPTGSDLGTKPGQPTTQPGQTLPGGIPWPSTLPGGIPVPPLPTGITLPGSPPPHSGPPTPAGPPSVPATTVPPIKPGPPTVAPTHAPTVQPTSRPGTISVPTAVVPPEKPGPLPGRPTVPSMPTAHPGPIVPTTFPMLPPALPGGLLPGGIK